MTRTLYICGAGNPEGVRLALTVNRVEKRWDQIVLLDDDADKHGRSILGVEIVGAFSTLEGADRDSSEISNMVASTTARRAFVFRTLKSFGLPAATLIDPNVDTAGVEFEPGITVYQHVSFCATARVEAGAVVFTGAVVGHGCRIGRCSVVAPGAVINARVEMGEGVYMGTNASILPDLKIGSWATIGANSAVIQDVPPRATMMGVPAQVLMIEPLAAHAAEKSDSTEYRPEGSQARLQPDGTSTSPASPALERLKIAQKQFIDSRRAAPRPKNSASEI